MFEAIACWLCLDASLPPLWLEALLPDKNTATQVCQFNRAYACHLESLYKVWQREVILDQIVLNQKHYLWWDAVRDEYLLQDVLPRRRKLLWIIEQIGWENFVERNWPGMIPR